MALEVQIRSKENNGPMMDVRFSSPEGICSLLGETGSGKTRTLRSIAGLETPDEGRVALNDTVFYDSLQGVNLPVQARRIGFLFRNSTLFSHMTVKENIQAALLAGGLPLLRRDASKTRHLSRARQTLASVTDQYLEEYHLSGLGGYYPEELSPLQQRRAALARMMAADPQLILLDDPFADLNPYQKASFLQETRDLIQKKGLPCVFATRDMEEAYAMGGSILVLHEGHSELMQKKADFFAHPQTITAALLAGVNNVTDIRMLNQTHALAQEWGTIFCADREAEPVADAAGPAENSKRNIAASDRTANSMENGTASGHRSENHTAAEDPNPAVASSSPEEERRAKHREELREDLERSLRFELINMPQSDDNGKAAHNTAAPAENMPSDTIPGDHASTAADSSASAPLYPSVHWKKLPADLAAIGIRAEDFQAEPPAEGHFLTFYLHDVKAEDTPRTWTISFRPVEDKPGRLTWTIPKTAMTREQAAQVDKLYLPEDKLLWLRR